MGLPSDQPPLESGELLLGLSAVEPIPMPRGALRIAAVLCGLAAVSSGIAVVVQWDHTHMAIRLILLTTAVISMVVWVLVAGACLSCAGCTSFFQRPALVGLSWIALGFLLASIFFHPGYDSYGPLIISVCVDNCLALCGLSLLFRVLFAQRGAVLLALVFPCNAWNCAQYQNVVYINIPRELEWASHLRLSAGFLPLLFLGYAWLREWQHTVRCEEAEPQVGWTWLLFRMLRVEWQAPFRVLLVVVLWALINLFAIFFH